MLMREVMEAWDLIDGADTNGMLVYNYFKKELPKEFLPKVVTEKSDLGSTDILEWVIPGADGESAGGKAPTLAIIGRLGGVGTRPVSIGTVSDADGAVVAIAAALKFARSAGRGDTCKGDIKIVTHVCPNARTRDIPVKGQMQCPIPIDILLSKYETPKADALLSVDTTRGLIVCNHTGIAITATLVNGYLMRVSDDLMQIMSDVTNELPVILPITMQDITPYGTGVYHINSIMQPGNLFDGPVVGVATVAKNRVPGRATSASTPQTLEEATRFCVETARRYGNGDVEFYDKSQYDLLVKLYGDMRSLVGRRK